MFLTIYNFECVCLLMPTRGVMYFMVRGTVDVNAAAMGVDMLRNKRFFASITLH